MTTVFDRLEFWALSTPDRPALSGWGPGERTRRPLTFAELEAVALAATAGLRASGVVAGDRVLLVLPNTPEFVCALLGCVGIGAIAVPAPTPSGTRWRTFEDRMVGIAGDCSPRLLVTTAEYSERMPDRLTEGSDLRILTWEALLAAADGHGRVARHKTDPSDPLLLQYTSGSTGRPKGVVVTHAMADAQCGQAREVYRETRDDVAVTWVPMCHDMGLVTGALRPLHSGYHSVLMEAREFVARPRSWLEAIHARQGSLSSAPNFAFELCIRKVALVADDPLDLSSWRLARNAGEVVRASTADRFTAAFAPAGFPATSLCPSYGMAEATLTVATCSSGVPPRRITTDQGDVILSSGVPLPGTEVAVHDAETHDDRGVGTRKAGELWIRGPQVLGRYWPDRSAAAEDGWVRTRDLGFIDGGHVFVLGRTDDTVVFNGRKYFGHDVHDACMGITGLRPGRCVAVTAPRGDEPEVVWLVGEISAEAEMTEAALARTAAQAREAVYSRTGLGIRAVGLLPPGTMPLTTSGKVQVGKLRDGLAADSLQLVWRD